LGDNYFCMCHSFDFLSHKSMFIWLTKILGTWVWHLHNCNLSQICLFAPNPIRAHTKPLRSCLEGSNINVTSANLCYMTLHWVTSPKWDDGWWDPELLALEPITPIVPISGGKRKRRTWVDYNFRNGHR